MLETENERKSRKLEKNRLFRPWLRWEIFVASSLNYAGVMVLLVFWKTDLIQYILLMLGASLMMGAILVDVDKAFIYSFSGLIVGTTLAIAIYMAPYNIFGESVGAVNVATLVVLSLVGKHLLIGVAPYLVGTILGCLIGEELR